MGEPPPYSFMGLLYLETYFNSGHVFLPRLWDRVYCTYRDYNSLSSLALSSRLLDPYDHIYNVEALKEKRHSMENKWLSYQKRITKAYKNV